MSRHFIVLSVLAAFMAFSGPSLSAETDSQQDESSDRLVFDLGQIEVVGKAEKVETTAVTEIQEEEFVQKLTESVVQAVESSPGIVLTVGDKNEPQILMRGLYQERILVLYDGVPMAAPYYGDLDASELPLDNLNTIKLIRGNSSVLYGPNAMGGVIALTSSKPSDKPNLSVLAMIDQESNYAARLTHGARFNQFYYQLAFGLRESDGWQMSDDFKPTYDDDGEALEDGDIRDNSQFSQMSGGLKLGLELDNTELSLSMNYIDGEKGLPPSTSPEARTRWWEYPVWKKATAVLAAKTLITSAVELRANVFYHQYDNVLKNYRDPAHSQLQWESTYDDYATGAMARLAWTISEQVTLRTSLQGFLDNHRAQGDVGDPWEEYEANTYALAVEGEWSPCDYFSSQLGASWESYQFDTVSNLEADNAAIANRTDDVTAPAFDLIGSLKPLEDVAVTLGISKKNRFPTMHLLFSNIEEYDPEDVEKLESEEAMVYSIGCEYKPVAASELGASLFYYDIDNMIERADRDSMFDNIRKVSINGLELWGNHTLAAGLKLGLAYTYLTTSSEIGDGDDNDLPLLPDHTVQVKLGYAFSFGTGITLDYLYRSDATEYDDYGESSTVPSYSSVDLTIRHDFDFGLGLILQGQNLLDENYYQELGFEQPGRRIKLGVLFTM